MIFSPQATGRDYHRAFNASNFIEYFRGTMSSSYSDRQLGLVAQFEAQFPGHSALFIMDNAADHKVFTGAPLSTHRKSEMVAFLREHGVEDDESSSKERVYLQVVQLKDALGCDVQRYARGCGHDVLFLPPHYSRWNPIEFYRAAAKRSVAEQFRSDRSMSETMDQLVDALEKYGVAAHTSKMVAACDRDVEETMENERMAEERNVGFDSSEVDPYISEEEDGDIDE